MLRHHCLLHFRSLSSALPLPSRRTQTHLIQCNNKIQQLAKLGRVHEARQVFDSMSQRDSISWNSMITGYTRNGLLPEARALFNSFQGKNVVTWTTLLTGFAKHGLVDEARSLFESMPERSVVSWNAMVSGYVQNGDLKRAKEVFDEIPERNIASWNSMITGYCRCGMMSKAREVFDQMEEKNYVSWMVMISGYVETSEYREAWGLFLMMLRCGMRPDQAIFVVALSAVTGVKAHRLVESLRTFSVKIGYEDDVVVGMTVLNAYTRSGSLDSAIKFFETMPERNEYTWSTMIAAFSQRGRLNDALSLYERATEKGVATRTTMMAAYARSGNIHEARHMFDEIINPSVVTWNAIIAGYAQNGMLEEAKDMFMRVPLHNSASWAALISGFAQSGQYIEALNLFAELHRSGTDLSRSCFTIVLFACTKSGDVEIGQQIHSLTIKTRYQFNLFVGNGLISLYGKCKNIEDISQVFSIMRARDRISWNPLITGLPRKHMLKEAQTIFDKMSKWDVVSWTSIISAYEQAGKVETAFKLFLEMLARGTKPNELTAVSLLSACGSLGATRLGEQIHVMIRKLGLNSCLGVCNALMTMYFQVWESRWPLHL